MTEPTATGHTGETSAVEGGVALARPSSPDGGGAHGGRPHPPEWLPLREAAAAAGVPLTRLRRWCDRGGVLFRKDGRRRLVLLEDVRARAVAELGQPVVVTSAETIPDSPARPAEGGDRAADDDVQDLLRSARADIARLSLQLRSIRRKADDAERRAGTAALGDEGADIAAARRLLQAGLRDRLDARRRELADELDKARAEATTRAASACRRADAYVAAAHDSVLASVLSPDEGLAPLPRLSPAIDLDDLVGPDDAGAPPTDDIGTGPAPIASPEGAPDIATLPSPFAEQGAMAWAAATGLPATPYPSPLLPPAAGAGLPSGAQAPAQGSRIAGPAPWSRLLFADVLLPLIAAVVVLVILLAWAG